jgi:uncharacterized damage-inducible protein DinB
MELRNKQEFLNRMQEAQDQLEAKLAGLSDEQLTQRPAPDAWSLRDTLQHLTYWEQYMLNIVRRAVEANEPPQWVTNEEETAINAQLLVEANQRPPQDVLADFRRSSQEVKALVESLPEDVLTDSNRFAWLKGQPLWTYIANESFGEHREEHLHQTQSFKYKFIKV